VVKWTAPAKLDLKDVHDYIARDSNLRRKVTQEIVDKSARLKNILEIGRIVPEIDDPNIRELFVYSYSKRSKRDRFIFILTMLHGLAETAQGRSEVYEAGEKKAHSRWGMEINSVHPYNRGQ